MILLSLAAILLWAVIATIELVARDGYGPVPYDQHYESARPHYSSVARTF